MATSVGACLIANEPDGLAEKMIERRVAGVSWKDIADEFGLGSPSTARKQFTKLTGITDYKAKGSALKKIVSDLKGLQDGQVKAAATAVKQTDEVLKPPPQVANAIKQKPIKKMDADLEDIKTAIDQMYGPGKADEVLKALQDGKGYTAIKQSTGVDFKYIDQFAWRQLLVDKDGNVWKAYVEKPTSENGFNAVKTLVNDAKIDGMLKKDIVDEFGIPDTVVGAIEKGTWHVPSPGATKPFIPEPPPAPPKSTGTIGPSEAKFQYHPKTKWDEWANSLGNDMSSAELAAVQNYTGSGYRTINNALRAGRSNSNAAHMDRAMRPIPFDTRVTRQMGTEGFQSLGINTSRDLHSQVGKMFADDGFYSTTIVEHGVWGGDVKLQIDLPKGTMGRWVGNGVSMHNNEREFILARGTRMMITGVEDVPGSRGVIVHMRVL